VITQIEDTPLANKMLAIMDKVAETDSRLVPKGDSKL
jgi:hypothetical protein